MTKNGLITRLHGGAYSGVGVGMESLFDIRLKENTLIKKMIGKEAAKLVSEGDCIAIDVGSTAYEVSKSIKNLKNITVLTASIPVINELCDLEDVKVIATGGEVSRKDKSLVGIDALSTINNYILDIAFIGVAGISFDFGFTMFNMNDTIVKKEITTRSKSIVVVADSSKLNTSKHAFFGDLILADKLIIDDGVSKDDLERLRDLGIDVIVVSKKG